MPIAPSGGGADPGWGSNRAVSERDAFRARVTSRALVSRAPGCPSTSNGVDLTVSSLFGEQSADDLNVQMSGNRVELRCGMARAASRPLVAALEGPQVLARDSDGRPGARPIRPGHRPSGTFDSDASENSWGNRQVLMLEITRAHDRTGMRRQKLLKSRNIYCCRSGC